MATSPNPYGRFIGRVGALAVALGIGAAIANSPGLAAADDGAPSAGSAPDTSNTTGPSGTESDPTSPGSGVPGDAQNGAVGERDETEATHETDNLDDVDEAEDDLQDDLDEETEETPDKVDEPQDPDVGNSSRNVKGTPALPLARIRIPDTLPAEDDDLTETVETRTTIPQVAESQYLATDSGVDTTTSPAPQVSLFTRVAPESTPPIAATPVTTGLGGVVSTMLSALGFGPQATSVPGTPPQPPMLWAMLGWVRRELGHVITPTSAKVGAASAPVAALVTQDVTTAAVSPLGTPEQLAAERLAVQTANTLPVALMKLVLRQGFLAAAQQQYGTVDAANMARLDKAVNEYAMAAAFQQQLLNSMTPTVVTQVAPPHFWYGQNVPGSRILYDNPDTIYRFMGVNGASQYEIRGQFLNYDPEDRSTRPADTTFSVLEGVAGTTSTILTVDDDFEIDEDGRFVITVSTAPSTGPNHLQLTTGSTIIAARNTLGDWNTEELMSLSIERVGGPPNSLFAQLGGFAFLGNLVSGNPLLTALVSLVPPLPYMPPVLRGAITALILVVRGAQEQSKYMALASDGEPNTVTQPSSNAEFLANQRQSNGNFDLGDDDYLVLEIDPGSAKYFIVPTYDIWTITGDYWNDQTSLNNEQALGNPGEEQTYTVVISKKDPGVTNWVSTGGLNRGAISIRFQDLGPDPDADPPRILSQQVVSLSQVKDFYPDEAAYFVDENQRAEQLALRKAGYDKRWAPFPQI